MVLLILAIVWAVVLGPSLLRRRAERRSNDSIGDFHRQLRILERTGPTIVDPAHRLDTEGHAVPGPFRAPSVRPGRPLVGAGSLDSADGGPRRPDPYFRPEACKRRRDVLLGLVCVLVGTGLLGAIPPLRPLLYVTIAGAVALAAYVGLLVYLRTLAIEREMKLRYLPQTRAHESTIVVRRVAAR